MDNYIMLQYFEWYLAADGKHWQHLREKAEQLAGLGISGVWIPPCTKGTSPDDVGYGVYDLYDLGEFDQKGAVRTKYGTKQELQEAIAALHDHGLKVYADVVLNHKAGADETEKIRVVKVDSANREKTLSEPFEIEAWTRFLFPARQGRYSEFKWGWQHFTATDYDQATGQKGIFRILGKDKYWSEQVDDEFGNYDYLMFADIDYQHPDVVAETMRWGEWFIKELQLDGLRLDAIKHINEDFIRQFVNTMKEKAGRDFYVVGEYWKNDTEVLQEYLEDVDYYLTVFDVALHFNLFKASQQGRDFDLRRIFDGTLVQSNPLNVVTFVDNHDSQQGQSLQSWVEDWFKPLAYALILLRRDGYPCLFFGDYYGIGGPAAAEGKRDMLDPLLAARRLYAYGEQVDTFDHANVIAWQRLGDEEHPGSGLAVVLSNGETGDKHLSFGPDLAGTEWLDLTGNRTESIQLDDQGEGTFTAAGGSVSVWVRKKQA